MKKDDSLLSTSKAESLNKSKKFNGFSPSKVMKEEESGRVRQEKKEETTPFAWTEPLLYNFKA